MRAPDHVWPRSVAGDRLGVDEIELAADIVRTCHGRPELAASLLAVDQERIWEDKSS